MKRMTVFAVSAVFVLFALCPLGCQSPRREFVEAVSASAEVIVPSLIEYLEADPELPAADRAARIGACREFREMVREEMGRDTDGDSE